MSRRATRLLVLAGLAVFVVTTLALHAAQPTLSPRDGAVSYYVHGNQGGLLTIFASLVPVFVRPGPPVLLGLSERILLAVYVVWLAAVAIHLPASPAVTPKEDAR